MASVRNIEHVMQGSLAGADIAIIPGSFISNFVKHPLTDKGIERDWEKVSQVN